MGIIICCDMLKDFISNKYIDIENEMIFVGDKMINYRMKYCPFCGKQVKFIKVYEEVK